MPPPPGPVPEEEPVAVEAVVPPAEPAEHVEGVEVIAWVFCDFCVCSSRSLPAFRLLGRVVLYLLVSVLFLCVSLLVFYQFVRPRSFAPS